MTKAIRYLIPAALLSLALLGVTAGCSSTSRDSGIKASAPSDSSGSVASPITDASVRFRQDLVYYYDECVKTDSAGVGCSGVADPNDMNNSATLEDKLILFCQNVEPAGTDPSKTAASVNGRQKIIIRGKATAPTASVVTCTWGQRDVDDDYIEVGVTAPLPPAKAFDEPGCESYESAPKCQLREGGAFFRPPLSGPLTDSDGTTQIPVVSTYAASGNGNVRVQVVTYSTQKRYQDDRVAAALKQAALYLGVPAT